MVAVADLSPVTGSMAAAAVVIAIICNLLEARLPHHQVHSDRQRSKESEVVPMVKRTGVDLTRAVTVVAGSIATGVAAAALG
jgi:hypothetical protein